METERDKLAELLMDSKKNLNDRHIVVWGVGNTAKLYQENIRRLEEEGLNIECYADSSMEKWGKLFCGKVIINPKEIKTIDNVFVIICSMNEKNTAEIKKLLSDLEIENATVDETIFSRHYHEVLNCYDMLTDPESKKVYVALIEARMKVQNPSLDIISTNQYYLLPQFRVENVNETLVECGGYIGDTLEAYVREKKGVFGQIISFEPDSGNMIRMKERVETLLEEFNLDRNKITLYPYAVGDKEEKVILVHSDTNKGNLTQVVPYDININSDIEEYRETIVLDHFLTSPYSFLKADVEGYEKKVLAGAEKGIKRYKPLLAICIYHNAMDFYEIPLMIKKMVPEYKLSIRHHLNTLSESVVYAYIED